LLERFDLGVPDGCEELEAHDLARREGVFVVDKSVEQLDRRPNAAQMVDGDRRVEELHSKPSRRRRSLRSPRIVSTYSAPVKGRSRHEPALACRA
jgi:hypothetical protein